MSLQDDDLKSLWQSTPAIDTTDLLARVARERRRMAWLLWAEIAGTIIGVGAMWIYDAMGLFGEHRWLAWLVTVIAVAAQLWMWYWRRGLWEAVSEAPMDLLQLQLKRARLGLKLARYYAYGTPLATIAGFLTARFMASDLPRIDMPDTLRVTVIVALLGFVVALTLCGFFAARRYRARIQWIEERLRAFGKDQIE